MGGQTEIPMGATVKRSHFGANMNFIAIVNSRENLIQRFPAYFIHTGCMKVMPFGVTLNFKLAQTHKQSAQKNTKNETVFTKIFTKNVKCRN